MDKLLEVIGSLGICAVLLTLVLLASASQGGTDAAIVVLGSLPWAVPALIGCVIIAAFGVMLGELKAIRLATEIQSLHLRDLVKQRDRS
jgi:hypothetical protein